MFRFVLDLHTFHVSILYHICFILSQYSLWTLPSRCHFSFFTQKKKKSSKTLQCCVNKLKVHAFGIVVLFFRSYLSLFLFHSFNSLFSFIFGAKNKTVQNKKHVNLLKTASENPKCRVLKCLANKITIYFYDVVLCASKMNLFRVLFFSVCSFVDFDAQVLTYNNRSEFDFKHRTRVNHWLLSISRAKY